MTILWIFAGFVIVIAILVLIEIFIYRGPEE